MLGLKNYDLKIIDKKNGEVENYMNIIELNIVGFKKNLQKIKFLIE
jgi:hypothetical protein